MLVAEGAAEIGCEPVVSLWDLAAPQVIVEEAGGTFTDLAGVPTAAGGDALATNGLLHEEALALVAALSAGIRHGRGLVRREASGPGSRA